MSKKVNEPKGNVEEKLKCPDCGNEMHLSCSATLKFKKVGNRLTPVLNLDSLGWDFDSMILYCDKCQYEDDVVSEETLSTIFLDI